MPLLTHFPNLTLTTSQSQAVGRLEQFFVSEAQVFILKGYAGTGKTTLLKGLAQYLQARQKLACLMAPTGRAARIITEKTGFDAVTIHKGIYDFAELKTYTTEEEGQNTYKYYFALAPNTYNAGSVFLVDEASMVGNRYIEGEFFRFGSGHLLNDLLSYLDLPSRRAHKIVFVGDPAQLPPVGENVSSALDAGFFRARNLRVMEAELREVVRQQQGSGILANAAYYRELIEQPQPAENNLNTNYPDVELITHTQVVDKVVAQAPRPQPDKAIIIAYSNSSTYDYNRLMRQHYFPGADTPQVGDILQIVKNNYKNMLPLLNGDFVQLVEVAQTCEYQSAPVVVAGKRQKVTLAFRNARIRLASGAELAIKLNDTLLNSRHRDLSAAESRALYINFKIRFDKEHNNRYKPDSVEFKKALASDPYFNALQVKYGYAITCHKAQGGEWPHVVVDFANRYGLHKEVLRWTYTAITRAAEQLYVLNPPVLRQFDFAALARVNIGRLANIGNIKINYPEVPHTPFHGSDSHPAKRLKYFELAEKFTAEGWRILSVVSRDYQEIYQVLAGGEQVRLTMTHAANGLFSGYAVHPQTSVGRQCRELAATLTFWDIPLAYEPANRFLQQLYQHVSQATDGLPVQLLCIDESRLDNYQVIYYLQTATSYAFLQFFFNQNQVVTNVVAKSTLAAQDNLLQQLLDNLTT